MKSIPSTKRIRQSKAAVKRAIKRINQKMLLLSELDRMREEMMSARINLIQTCRDR